MDWFSVACELHREWRNDIEGLSTLFSHYIPNYRNLTTSYFAKGPPKPTAQPAKQRAGKQR